MYAIPRPVTLYECVYTPQWRRICMYVCMHLPHQWLQSGSARHRLPHVCGGRIKQVEGEKTFSSFRRIREFFGASKQVRKMHYMRYARVTWLFTFLEFSYVMLMSTKNIVHHAWWMREFSGYLIVKFTLVSRFSLNGCYRDGNKNFSNVFLSCSLLLVVSRDDFQADFV